MIQLAWKSNDKTFFHRLHEHRTRIFCHVFYGLARGADIAISRYHPFTLKVFLTVVTAKTEIVELGQWCKARSSAESCREGRRNCVAGL